MHTLARALRSWQGRGRPVEIPFRDIDKLVDLRTGQIAVLAGAPGGGKSSIAVNWAWRSSQPVLYLAQDRPLEVYQRLAAIALDRRVDEIDPSDLDYWGQRIERMRKRDTLVIQRGAQTVENLGYQIEALTEWLMEPPHLVFVDNLFDMRVEGSSYMDVGFYADVLPAVKQLAIEKDVCVCLLHHVTRSGEKGKKHGQGTDPLTMTDLLFGGEREAAHVWGVYRRVDNRQLIFQVLKQGGGRADAGGNLRVPLDWQPEKAVVYSR